MKCIKCIALHGGRLPCLGNEPHLDVPSFFLLHYMHNFFAMFTIEYANGIFNFIQLFSLAFLLALMLLSLEQHISLPPSHMFRDE